MDVFVIIIQKDDDVKEKEWIDLLGNGKIKKKVNRPLYPVLINCTKYDMYCFIHTLIIPPLPLR